MVDIALHGRVTKESGQAAARARCDTITTVGKDVLGDTIGLFFDDQEGELARAVSDAFELYLP